MPIGLLRQILVTLFGNEPDNKYQHFTSYLEDHSHPNHPLRHNGTIFR